ncbi:MAG: hypothetical protein JJE05_07920 [Actinobacteria bacterium]|nr:hypothetical protein [Actinomycetota bacterium]
MGGCLGSILSDGAARHGAFPAEPARKFRAVGSAPDPGRVLNHATSDSAEALERGLDAYRGAVIAVTHDRWFMRLMDRFLVFHRDGSVTEEIESPYGVMVDG